MNAVGAALVEMGAPPTKAVCLVFDEGAHFKMSTMPVDRALDMFRELGLNASYARAVHRLRASDARALVVLMLEDLPIVALPLHFSQPPGVNARGGSA